MLEGIKYYPSDTNVLMGGACTAQLVQIVNGYDMAVSKAEEFGAKGEDMKERSASQIASRNVTHAIEWAQCYGYAPSLYLIHIETLHNWSQLIHEMEAF